MPPAVIPRTTPQNLDPSRRAPRGAGGGRPSGEMGKASATLEIRGCVRIVKFFAPSFAHVVYGQGGDYAHPLRRLAREPSPPHAAPSSEAV